MTAPAKSWWSTMAAAIWIDDNACRAGSTVRHRFVQAASEMEAVDMATANLDPEFMALTPTIQVFKCPETRP